MKVFIFLLFTLYHALSPALANPDFLHLTPDVQEMQNNDAKNPSFLWIMEGERMVKQECATCHTSFEGAALSYPKTINGSFKNLNEQINVCVSTRLNRTSLQEESRTLLALEGYITLQSRGMKSEPKEKDEKGEAFYNLRQGQLNLSCANCHDDNAGKMLYSSRIPHGFVNSYPQYRLEWQSFGSLKRRIKNCLTGVRAKFPENETFNSLENYLKFRGLALPSESPGVRP